MEIGILTDLWSRGAMCNLFCKCIKWGFRNAKSGGRSGVTYYLVPVPSI